MIDTNNRAPRTVMTPDGYGELFSVEKETTVVKIQVGERRFLRLYATELCEEVPNGDKKD